MLEFFRHCHALFQVSSKVLVASVKPCTFISTLMTLTSHHAEVRKIKMKFVFFLISFDSVQLDLCLVVVFCYIE